MLHPAVLSDEAGTKSPPRYRVVDACYLLSPFDQVVRRDGLMLKALTVRLFVLLH